MRMQRWICGALKAADEVMFGETITDVAWDGRFPSLDDERSQRRHALAKEQIVWSLTAMGGHYTDGPDGQGHSNCTHGKLSDNHIYFTCPQQKVAFLSKIDEYKHDVGSILSPKGKLDIQVPESNHGKLQKLRHKGTNDPPEATLMVEGIGFLECASPRSDYPMVRKNGRLRVGDTAHKLYTDSPR